MVDLGRRPRGSSEGNGIQFFFGQPEPTAVMEVIRLSPHGHVSWRCVEGADEWVGTELNFDLTRADDETVVLFTHADWREPTEFMAHCSGRWAYFLLSLKQYLETGKETPFPEDLKFRQTGCSRITPGGDRQIDRRA